MQNLDEARRLNGAMHEQIRINEEIAEQSKSDAKPGEAKWAGNPPVFNGARR